MLFMPRMGNLSAKAGGDEENAMSSGRMAG